jgi:hypothetical protein
MESDSVYSKDSKIQDSAPDRFLKSKTWRFYYEGFGDSGEVCGETTRHTMKDLGNKMKDLGRYYEVFGEDLYRFGLCMKIRRRPTMRNLGDPAGARWLGATSNYEGFGEAAKAGWRLDRSLRWPVIPAGQRATMRDLGKAISFDSA